MWGFQPLLRRGLLSPRAAGGHLLPRSPLWAGGTQPAAWSPHGLQGHPLLPPCPRDLHRGSSPIPIPRLPAGFPSGICSPRGGSGSQPGKLPAPSSSSRPCGPSPTTEKPHHTNPNQIAWENYLRRKELNLVHSCLDIENGPGMFHSSQVLLGEELIRFVPKPCQEAR